MEKIQQHRSLRDYWDNAIGMSLAAFILGWWASTAWYQVPVKGWELHDRTAKLEHAQKVVIPTLKKEVAKAKREKTTTVIFVPNRGPNGQND